MSTGLHQRDVQTLALQVRSSPLRTQAWSGSCALTSVCHVSPGTRFLWASWDWKFEVVPNFPELCLYNHYSVLHHSRSAGVNLQFIQLIGRTLPPESSQSELLCSWPGTRRAAAVCPQTVTFGGTSVCLVHVFQSLRK